MKSDYRNDVINYDDFTACTIFSLTIFWQVCWYEVILLLGKNCTSQNLRQEIPTRSVVLIGCAKTQLTRVQLLSGIAATICETRMQIFILLWGAQVAQRSKPRASSPMAWVRSQRSARGLLDASPKCGVFIRLMAWPSSL